MAGFEPDPPSGDFEAGTVGAWSPALCTLEPDNVGAAHGGSWSMKMTSTGGFGRTMSAHTPNTVGTLLPITPGRYRVGGWARNASADIDHYDFRLGWLNDAGDFLAIHNFPRRPAPLSEWVEIGNQVAAAPPGTTKFLLQAYASTPIGGPDLAAGQVVNWDDFYFESTPTQGGIVIGIPASG